MIYKIKENRVSRTYIGGKAIDAFYGKDHCINGYAPEDWTASVTPSYNSKSGLEEGVGYTEEGISVKDIIGEGKLGMLVKLLNSAERLVIQAHPTVPFAREFLNSDYGKTECWYFLECEEEAYVYIGFKKGVQRSDWEKAFYENDSEKMLSMLHRVPVKKGDFIFVDGGVPHAIGSGCFMIELQEPSDLMVVNERFTPSGREIPEQRLHMGLGYAKMFDVYVYTGYSYSEIQEKYCPKPRLIGEGLYEILGSIQTDKFAMYLLMNGSRLQTPKQYKIAIVISGKGMLCGKQVGRGDRFLLQNETEITAVGTEDLQIVLCAC